MNDKIIITSEQIHKLKTYKRVGKFYKQNGRWYASGASLGRTFGKFEQSFIDTLEPGQIFTNKNGLKFLTSLLKTAYEKQKNFLD